MNLLKNIKQTYVVELILLLNDLLGYPWLVS
jgi:hypothetical protein